MFDFIKKLFSGITAFFGGLFGGGKKALADTSSAPKTKKGKGFFMELDEAGNTKPVTEAKKPEAKKPEPAKAESEANDKKPEPAKAAVVTIERPKAGESEPVAEVPSGNGKVKIEAQPNSPAPNLNGKVDPKAEPTFAPNYLLSTNSSSRRRPGPSMDIFRDMARQVKTPS